MSGFDLFGGVTTMATEIVYWHGCYDASWRDLIVPEAFAHPAKMSRALVARIFDELFARGAITDGDRRCPGCGLVVEPKHYGWNITTTSRVRATEVSAKVHTDEGEPEVLQRQLWSQDISHGQVVSAPLERADAGLRAMRGGVQAEAYRDAVLPEAVCEHMDGAASEELQGRPHDQREGLRPDPEPEPSKVSRGSLCVRASAGNGASSRSSIATERSGSPQERHQDRQRNREPRGAHETDARSEATAARQQESDADDVSVLPKPTPDVASCPNCGGPYRLPSLIADPFGGIGTTCLESAARGCRSIACELEPRFVALANENFLLHRQDWEAMGRPQPRIVQGDSRKLRQCIGGVLAEVVVSSPPYSEGLGHGGGTCPITNDTRGTAQAMRDGYGETPGQLGELPTGSVAAVISSPPYAEIASGSGGLNTKPAKEGQQGGRSPSSPSQDTDSRYGTTSGQLARMALGEVDAVVSSPPYEDSVNSDGHGIDWSKADPKWKGGRRRGPDTKHDQTLRDHLAYGDTPGQLGAMKGGAGVDAIVSSPPYSGNDKADNTLHDRDPRAERFTGAFRGSYGTSDGQLGAMPSGTVDAVVCSPPFASGDSASAQSMTKRTDKSAEWVKKNCGAAATEGYGETAGQLGVMPLGDVDAVVSSPPWGEDATGHVGSEKWRSPEDFLKAGRGKGASDEARLRQLERQSDRSYGECDGQLATMPMHPPADAVVSSPPYEGSLASSKPGIDWSAARRESAGGGEHQKPGASAVAAYPATDGNVGNTTGETFWSAALDIVRECYAVLRPGGTAVWVVKHFVRDKQIVDFPGDWRKLCESVGFVTDTEVHAMLVAEETKPHLFDGEVTIRRERKSFFRRLAEKKGSPRIDFETVYFMRKPV